MIEFNKTNITLIAIHIVCIIMVLASGCSMKLYKNSPADVRKCCDRVDAYAEEMEKFGRYCKVAVFLSNSENTKAVGAGVRKSARQAVEVCKFVFRVETDEDLISAGDRQDYYKVRSYIITEPDPNGFWVHPQCDPAEIHCEEF